MSIQLSLFGKTSQERCHQITGWTLRPLYNPSQTPKFQCLVLDDGLEPEWLEANGQISPGESWTPNFGESPSAAVESSLSLILEATAPDKYSLSAKACYGILRRAENRGKDLPAVLETALRQQMTTERDDRQGKLDV